MEFPCRGTVTCNNVFESFLRKFVITMSLFTRLGNCSVKRRTNRVFPKPPRCDETTRTESLKKKFSSIEARYFEPYRLDHTTKFLFLKSSILGTDTSVRLNKTLLQTLLLSPVLKGKLFPAHFLFSPGWRPTTILISRNISENLLFWV